jgi:hypothetical protein
MSSLASSAARVRVRSPVGRLRDGGGGGARGNAK